MKKLLSALLASAMALSLLAGCGGSGTPANGSNPGGSGTAAIINDMYIPYLYMPGNKQRTLTTFLMDYATPIRAPGRDWRRASSSSCCPPWCSMCSSRSTYWRAWPPARSRNKISVPAPSQERGHSTEKETSTCRLTSTG